MRRLLALVALLLFAALPAGAAQRTAVPVRVAIPLPAAGNATLVQLRVPLRGDVRRAGRLRLASRLRTRLPRRYAVTQAVTRRGNDLRVSVTIAHVLAKRGAAPVRPTTFDTQAFAVTATGAGRAPARGEAGLDLFLFDDATGRPLTGPAACTSACRFSLPRGTKLRYSIAENVASPHRANRAVCLGFALIVTDGGDSVNIQSFVTNARTSPFDVSILGLASGARASDVAFAANAGAADLACNKRTRRADRLRRALGGGAKPAAGLRFERSIAHGQGRSNVCLRVRGRAGASGTVVFDGPGGNVGRSPVTLSAAGETVVVYTISSYGTYTARASIGGVSGTFTVRVGAQQGGPVPCPPP